MWFEVFVTIYVMGRWTSSTARMKTMCNNFNAVPSLHWREEWEMMSLDRSVSEVFCTGTTTESWHTEGASPLHPDRLRCPICLQSDEYRRRTVGGGGWNRPFAAFHYRVNIVWGFLHSLIRLNGPVLKHRDNFISLPPLWGSLDEDNPYH